MGMCIIRKLFLIALKNLFKTMCQKYGPLILFKIMWKVIINKRLKHIVTINVNTIKDVVLYLMHLRVYEYIPLNVNTMILFYI